ncbi:MAG: ankyrin repeat domain-containing protein [Treponema sp.]|nr:ankyrin repeat domain-containing protein [Treponema sp.]
MKRSLFAQLCVFCCFLAVFSFLSSCKGAPPAAEEPVFAEETEDDIWSLLQRGDGRARSFFLGEVEANATDSNGKTPLHYAAEKGDQQLASFFLSIDANANVLDYSQQSPLGIAVERNEVRISEILVVAGADIHMPILGYTSAAQMALSRGGAILKSILTASTIESVDNDGKTILHLASINGNVNTVKDILSFSSATPIPINKNDNDGKNALDYALARTDSKSHIEIAEQLILSGAYSEHPVFSYFAPAVRVGNFNIRRNEGLAPIHFAVRDSSAGLISFLLEKNIDINIKSSSGSAPLHEAARAGNIQVMTMLLNNGADVNVTDAKGNTPLHIGIPIDVHREACSLLISRGANVNMRDEHGDTPLHIVIILNRPLDVLQTLLSGGGDVYIRNMEGKTPLYIAIEEKRINLIPILVLYNSEIFAANNSGITPLSLAVRDNNIFRLVVTPETVIQRDSAGNTILHSAVQNNGTSQQIGLVLDSRAHVEARNMEGDTALHIAVRMNQKENSEFLISRGANIYTANAARESPLYYALTAPDGIREWLINSTTIISKDGLGNNMLHYATQWKLNNAIPVIIQKGVPVDEQNATGETPLFIAVKYNSPSTIGVLLNNSANLNARDKQGCNALHTAVQWNAKDSAALLISSGIDINAHSLAGTTPLHDAIVYEMADIETILIKEGADLEVRDIDGNTPFMEAVRTGQMPSIDKLASNGANPSTRNNRGDTPLHIAVSLERYDLVNKLLSLGASIHARNANNRTPLRIAMNVTARMVLTLLNSDRINFSDDLGNSALHIALQERAPADIISALIGQGARINAVDNNGNTPLRMAIDMDLLNQVKLLADSGADPFFLAVDNKTPSDVAFVKGEDCVRAVFSGRAVNARDNSNNTILHYAARYASPRIIETLLELGANKTLRNISSEIPYDIAVRWNRTENAQLLRTGA